ncbi:MAG: radical SAM family heme chaperone HemW [Bacteroidales bacterium]|nr:radical SAM family heme chaperone HemW [Bacteroidales bacterium]
MAGIYIHIPFCKQLCYYCDFYFSLSLKNKDIVLDSIVKEIELKKDFFENDIIETIYFGGGTPSLLSIKEVDRILQTIFNYFKIVKNPEITFEANPDDINSEYIKDLFSLKINRLSIGLQSLNDKDLIVLNRKHTAKQSLEAIDIAANCGFENITVDLIYGIPNQTIDDWIYNLKTTLSYPITHLSAYSLTVENNTALNTFIRKKQLILPPEDIYIDEFSILKNYTYAHKFVHYELSNFGLEGFFSKHNMSYWSQKKYLGVGPSAHSFDGSKRYWNVANNLKYVEFMSSGNIHNTVEILSEKDKFNEYLMTSLRTMWGVNLEYLSNNFSSIFKDYFLLSIKKYLSQKLIIESNNFILLSDSGMLLSDRIISDLFYI